MDEIDRDWDDLPVAELHQLDAVCDRFEQALADDPETRIETFVADLPEPQQRLLVLELVQLEVERRRARGQVLTADEYAQRFPQWADDVRSLVKQTIEDFDRAGPVAAETRTVQQSSFSDTWSGQKTLRAKWADEWRESTSGRPLPDLPVDGVLGHFHLRSVIGRGGMSLVVRAHDTRLGRDVALKVLASELSHDANAHERFLREAQAVAGIQHENVVRIFGVEEIGGVPFLAMELVDGITLEEYLRDGKKLSPGEVVSLACQMAQGVAAAHKQGLVHRDIKPANILLQKVDQQDSGVAPLSTWHVKITDFGLARVAAKSQLTSPGVIAGTPQYMSPEQATGQKLDVRSDLFSLGSVMYTMCAGQAAFSAESAVAILRQVADVPARSLSEVSPETPDWLVAVIEKLMSKSPGDRFQSATEVAKVLGRHEQDLQNGITPSTSAAPRSIRKRLFAVALLMIAVIGFGIAQIVFRLQTPHGTLVVRTDDPDVQISVKSGGTEVALFFPTHQKEIPLKVGEYTIELVEGRNGLKLSTNKFEIQSGQDQRTVTVEFEPAVAVAADKEPPTVTNPPAVTEQATATDQAKAGDTEKPFAWPEEPLWHGLIAAPDLEHAKELYRHDFANDWPIVRTANGELGREDDTYFVTADPGQVQGAWIGEETYANFACEVVGRVISGGTQWYLNYSSMTNDVIYRFHLNGLQGVQLAVFNDGPARNLKTIRHIALKKGAEFNKLLVVAQGNRIEIFANDVAICDPIVLEKFAPPGRFALGGVSNHIAVRAEFKSFTIWSAEGLPTLEERLTWGEPYNAPPSPAKAKLIDTTIAPDPTPAIAPFTSAEADARQQAWAKHRGVPVEYVNSLGMKFRLIPPGEFTMGAGTSAEIEESLQFAASEYYAGLIKGEQPKHTVVLTQPFYMGVHEVTQDAYRTITGENPSSFAAGGAGEAYVAGLATEDFPVEMVSWDDAIDFCNQLSQLEGINRAYLREEGPESVAPGSQRENDTRPPHPGVGDTVTLIDSGYRLPTEAQWEFACRAGTTTRFWSGDTAEDLMKAGWFKANNDQRMHAVGELQANPFGLHDVHGNVWEWVQDRSVKNLYADRVEQRTIDPRIDNSPNEQRILRGGQWGSPATFCRSAVRPTQGRMHRINSPGFRVSLTVEAVQQAVASETSK